MCFLKLHLVEFHNLSFSFILLFFVLLTDGECGWLLPNSSSVTVLYCLVREINNLLN